MKNNTKKVIRFTSITEYKTLETYLQKMAAKGWMLCKINRNTLEFTKIDPRELTFNVSLFYHTTPFDYPNDEKEKDYRELCEESGWKFCASNEIYQIFYIESDIDVTDIHTDSQEEYNIIKKIYMKTDFISMILLFFVVGLQLTHIFNFNYEDILSNMALFTVISPVFLMIIMMFTNAPPIIWLIKNKINVSNGKELTFSTHRMRLTRNIFLWSLIGVYFILTILVLSNNFTSGFTLLLAFIPVTVSIIVAIYCIKRFKTKKRTRKQNMIFFSIVIILTTIITTGAVMAIVFSSIGFGENDDMPKDVAVLKLSDLGTEATPLRTRTHEKSSIFVPINTEYYESLGRKAKDNEIMTVRTTYIRCINNDIADYVFDGYMKEERKRLEERISEYLEYGDKNKAKEEENEISKVSTGLWKIDRGYYLSSNKSKIVIQKDNIIYILNCHVDFSEKEIVDICEEKFEL